MTGVSQVFVWRGQKRNNMKDKQKKPVKKFRTTVLWELKIHTSLPNPRFLQRLKVGNTGNLRAVFLSVSLRRPHDSTVINKLFRIDHLNGWLWIIL